MPNRTRLLYVDDEADIRGIIEYAMEDEQDFQLELCASGQEALDKAVRIKPDLILLDVMMPGMDGPTTLKQLRELPDTRTTPVIFVTAKVQPNEVAQFKALGAIDVIAKPFDPVTLAAHLRELLKLTTQTKARKKSDRIEKLRQVYQAELPGRMDAIATNWSALVADQADDNTLQELYRQVHSLVGSGMSFGYRQMGELAREIEQELGGLKSGEYPLSPGLIEQLELQFQRLHHYADAAPDITPTLQGTAVATQTDPRQRLVYVVEDDPISLELITEQLRMLDWEVRSFTDASSAGLAIKEKLPSAIVVDQSLPEGKLAGGLLLQEHDELRRNHIPQIIVSSNWNWKARLAAVRAGVDVYLRKPLDIAVLVENLDRLTKVTPSEPYRILIVEDTVTLAEHYAAVLENAGMLPRIVTEPEQLLNVLATYQPELILMDIYMPGCTGIEAARVIRQDSKFISVPIVFLSSETERQRQLGAMHSGADDFLMKPISNSDLVSAVTLRVERFRKLASVIHQDSLTGLLNHASFKVQMEIEFARAKRQRSNLCFILLDIDHFKKVNDTYGHPTGDKVLKQLAQLLSTHLRNSDLIGRYGGEEFAILLPDTAPEQALQVIENLREQFHALRFSAGNAEFNCAFSAGISSSLSNLNTDAMIKHADTALYEAKHAGRNRIHLEANAAVSTHTISMK